MKDKAGFGAVIYALIVATIGTLMKGWVLSILWGWFMVPTFGLPRLSVAPAIGMSLVIGYLTHQSSDCVEKEESTWEKLGKGTALAIFYPLFTLGVGAIVHAFM